MLDFVSPLWDAAKAVYEAAKEVKENYEECAAIQRTVQSLVKTIKTCTTVTETLREHIRDMTTTLQDLTKILKILATYTMFYRIMHRKSIKCRLQDTRKELETATSLFQVGAQAELLNALSEVNTNVQRIADAQRKDEKTVEERYVQLLKSSEVEMFQTLGVEERQMSDAMLALSKHMLDIPEGLEKRCCERGLDAMRRRTGEVIMDTDDFTLSSYEVSIRKDEKLGAGGFASVYRGTYRDGMAVAVKVLVEGAPPSALRDEVDVWKSLSHRNILQFIGVCSTADPPFMVCAYKKNGNALDYLRKKPKASRHKILYEASQGLIYLHDKRVVHGDIKATNILIDEDGTACLADFGLSRVKLQTTAALKIDSTPQKGTVRWMAPEQLGGSFASRKTDIYSFAMTIYETFTGRPPFPEHTDSLVFLMVHDKGIRPKFEEVRQEIRTLGLDTSMWSLIDHCWKQDPMERWSALELSEALHKLRSTTPLAQAPNRLAARNQVNPPGVGAKGRSLSDDAAYPPASESRFLQEPGSGFPRPSFEPQPQSAPSVPRQKDLPRAVPSIPAAPSPPPSYESAVRTIVPSPKAAPAEGLVPAPPPSSIPLVQPRPVQPFASKAAPVQLQMAGRHPPANHARTAPTPTENNSSAEPESFTRAATVALGSKTIPRPLSPESLITFEDPVYVIPKLSSPLIIAPLRGQPEPRQFSPQSTNTATPSTFEGLIFKGATANMNPVTHSDEVPLAQSRHAALFDSSLQGRGQGAPRTEPVRSKPLPPDDTPPPTPLATPTSSAHHDASPFEEGYSPLPSSGEQTPSTPSRSPFLRAGRPQPLQLDPHAADPFNDLRSHMKQPPPRASLPEVAPSARLPPSNPTAATTKPSNTYSTLDEEDDLVLSPVVTNFPPPASNPTVRARKE